MFYYFLFCSVTTICILILTAKVFLQVKPYIHPIGLISYFATTGILVFLFAPVFFIIYIFYSEVYVDALIRNIIDETE
jgi:hypothetical protein